MAKLSYKIRAVETLFPRMRYQVPPGIAFYRRFTSFVVWFKSYTKIIREEEEEEEEEEEGA